MWLQQLSINLAIASREKVNKLFFPKTSSAVQAFRFTRSLEIGSLEYPWFGWICWGLLMKISCLISVVYCLALCKQQFRSCWKSAKLVLLSISFRGLSFIVVTWLWFMVIIGNSFCRKFFAAFKEFFRRFSKTFSYLLLSNEIAHVTKWHMSQKWVL